MTRKDYVLIAAAMKRARCRLSEPVALDALGIAAEELAGALAADDAAFDRARFLAACGVRS